MLYGVTSSPAPEVMCCAVMASVIFVQGLIRYLCLSVARLYAVLRQDYVIQCCVPDCMLFSVLHCFFSVHVPDCVLFMQCCIPDCNLVRIVCYSALCSG